MVKKGESMSNKTCGSRYWELNCTLPKGHKGKHKSWNEIRWVNPLERKKLAEAKKEAESYG